MSLGILLLLVLFASPKIVFRKHILGRSKIKISYNTQETSNVTIFYLQNIIYELLFKLDENNTLSSHNMIPINILFNLHKILTN